MNNNKIDTLGTKIYLSMATAPFLLTVIAGKVIGEALTEMGEASEEIFRGQRLPILNLSEEKKGN